jgi:hypothetical protein
MGRMSSRLPDRKPWPMRWIVLAIAIGIAAYTFLTLHYRKPGRDYRPYEDMKTRANTLRLLEAGYRRIALTVSRPADASGERNTAFPAPGGIPKTLRATLVDLPLLPSEILDTHADATGDSRAAYEIRFRCATPDDKQQLAGAELYVKGDEIVITPDFEILAPGLLMRSRQTVSVLTVPAGALKPGSYRVTLVGERASRTWSLELK